MIEILRTIQRPGGDPATIMDDAVKAVISYLISGNKLFCTETDTMKRVLALSFSKSTDEIEDIPRQLHESYPTFSCSIDNYDMMQYFQQYPYPVSLSGLMKFIITIYSFPVLYVVQ
jgi:hypothetical protein